MGDLFGTDGIRGVAGEPPLDHDTVYRVGFCLTEYLKHFNPRPRILIGRDTRASGPWLEASLKRAIADAGGISECCGVLSTPAVSFLTNRTKAQAGIMISASHNPYQDNGIKIFSFQGLKFSGEIEEELERRINATSLALPTVLALSDGPSPETSLESHPRYCALYTGYLRECLPHGFRLDGMRLVVDCAHGSLYAIAPDFLRSLGADVHPLHCLPNGRNINLHAGALHLKRLKDEVGASAADLGVAFDGDADRAMFVDRQGRWHDGDDVLYLLARYMELPNTPRIVVGTVMANLGLELALADLGFGLVRTSVGDRYVLEEMHRLGAVLGGEQSGHVIFAHLAKTGDGLLTALQVLKILREQQAEIAQLCAPLKRYPQVLLNVPVREKVPLEKIPGLQELEAACKEKLGPRGRILVRYSGTEKLARIMVEGKDEALVQEIGRHLLALFEELRS